MPNPKKQYDFKHTFNGKKYFIDLEPFDGICDTPEDPYTAIRFPKGLPKDKYGLELAIHESLHACFPFMKEEDVTQSASDITDFLWKLKVRFEKRKKK